MAKKRRQEKKGREERPERNPEVTSLTAEVAIEGGFVAEVKASQDKRSGQVKEHVQLTFMDMSGKTRAFLLLHDYREATLAAFKAFKLGEGEKMTEAQEKQLLSAMNCPAHVSIREKGDFEYAVLKPAWANTRGNLMAYEQLPNQPLRESKPDERTLWFWRTGYPHWSLTTLKLVEAKND